MRGNYSITLDEELSADGPGPESIARHTFPDGASWAEDLADESNTKGHAA